MLSLLESIERLRLPKAEPPSLPLSVALVGERPGPTVTLRLHSDPVGHHVR